MFLYIFLDFLDLFFVFLLFLFLLLLNIFLSFVKLFSVNFSNRSKGLFFVLNSEKLIGFLEDLSFSLEESFWFEILTGVNILFEILGNIGLGGGCLRFIGGGLVLFIVGVVLLLFV